MSSQITITNKGNQCDNFTGLLHLPDYCKRTTVEDINNTFHLEYKFFDYYIIAKGNIIAKTKAKY